MVILKTIKIAGRFQDIECLHHDSSLRESYEHFCYLYLVFVMIFRLFIGALWSPAGKGLTSWLSFIMLNLVFVTFLCDILDQLWCLIALIPDLCQHTYSELAKQKENVQDRFCKRILNAPIHTSNIFARAECGRFPFCFACFTLLGATNIC